MPRRPPRVLVLWAAAATVAVVTAVVVGSDLAALHRRAGELGPVVRAVVARHDLPVGITVRASDVDERAVYRRELPRGALTGAVDAVGRVVDMTVPRGGYVVARNVAPRHRHGVDGVVPRGMRAMRVVATDAIRPRAGAAVDILATFDTGTGGTSADGATATTVIARGVVVLGTDARADHTRGDTLGVTVLVDRVTAPRLAFAQANGVVTLALVPPEDAESP